MLVNPKHFLGVGWLAIDLGLEGWEGFGHVEVGARRFRQRGVWEQSWSRSWGVRG